MPVLSNDAIQSPAIFNVLAQKPENRSFKFSKNAFFPTKFFVPHNNGK